MVPRKLNGRVQARLNRAAFSLARAEGRIFLKRMNGMNTDEDKMAVRADRMKSVPGHHARRFP